jgi:hypothetical protein
MLLSLSIAKMRNEFSILSPEAQRSSVLNAQFSIKELPVISDGA